ncbi:energy-coupling factor ABC transporter ATP-binding protein [Synergistes jonesii]|uniref:energy-coupling factor ABC transporter ATP-binding protein n=1 Tax=Synergistes jonesii TaxID=2754 RepID=UPI000569E474|nr:energy-coupling factor ABC transporter ATP-binding protein [Synergistes jonesii]MDY2984981.1 energy-coupling factor ABC transporter ATP-binding protein [Synergistes jonesii]OFB62009.1 cobalt ABC transporter ATP-binding protein [Synergistes jonesii]OFB62382.1 cobalt ABC transporter ATP-binding protein [Synergistes jonesii]OFB64303.1 cobalt ABC transporter ATP-binding protein [Synergistes jonesii]OFB67369.1 cobalt ABC transporter ATP-binding protein [Synergistes jonesii]
MFVLEDLTVTYPDGTRAVEGVSFRLAPGESAVLAGANGAGKSSLILAAVGVLPSTGMVCADGVTLEKKNLAELRRRVGVLFQNPDDQLFSATIYDDIAFGPRNMGLSAEETERRVSEALALLGIEYLRGKTALKLSGGEKRLAALASVLAMKPSVLLFDEPTAFLDPRARRNLIKIMNGLPQTKLIASHDLPFAGAVASRAIVLKRGRLFADGAAREILRDEKLMEEGGL